jgi:hypothetical protein
MGDLMRGLLGEVHDLMQGLLGEVHPGQGFSLAANSCLIRLRIES